MTNSILIIDDDRFLAQGIARLLRNQGYEVNCAHSAVDGERCLALDRPDLLVLDLCLPDGDGISICRKIRQKDQFPILMLTSRSDSIDKVVGFEVGADDYMTKPFDPHELSARVKALLRRMRQMQSPAREHDPIQIGPMRIDGQKREVRVDDHPITLTNTEFELLTYLAMHVGKACPREEIFTSVWGYSSEFSSNSLDVVVYRLRNKLKPYGLENMVETVRGFGFKLTDPDVELA
ncbi:MAG: response regulator transcription factor [Armatimonadetes bacterium]|nr:response regulator transcription factor [Armatimonadota bacterium]